ncbi:uncharacterized protein TrAFT101_010996 [Trichoderma asperellum]|uniref:uncharacterized protein n=1 Tax=Trichoderma asperellum TaxID=101201 RepID=UPI003329D903|nr:hypothetical protein TrAFT101_010996 [Trichoderma asperellum]
MPLGRVKRLSKSWRQEFFCDEDVIKKEFRVVEHKQFVLDRIETRTAGPAGKDANAVADAVLEKIVKEDQEQEEQEKEDEK